MGKSSKRKREPEDVSINAIELLTAESNKTPVETLLTQEFESLSSNGLFDKAIVKRLNSLCSTVKTILCDTTEEKISRKSIEESKGLQLLSTKNNFAFKPPTVVKPVGSFSLGLMSLDESGASVFGECAGVASVAGSRSTKRAATSGTSTTNATSDISSSIDIAVELPASIFGEKDASRCVVYADKRNVWLNALAEQLNESGEWTRVRALHLRLASLFQFETPFDGVTALPILAATFASTNGRKWPFSTLQLRIIPCMPKNVLQLERLYPNVSNISEHSELPSTVLNAAISRDCMPIKHLSLLDHALRNINAKTSSNPSTGSLQMLSGTKTAAGRLLRALYLIRIWRQKQCILNAFDMPTSYALTILAIQHVSQASMARSSAFDVFRSLLAFLATDMIKVLTVQGLQWNTHKTINVESSVWQSHKSIYDAVFLDSDGIVNLMANVSLDALQELSAHAHTALQLLESCVSGTTTPSDVVSALFLQRTPALARFDVILRVNINQTPSTLSQSLCVDEVRTARNRASTALKSGTVERVVRWRWLSDLDLQENDEEMNNTRWSLSNKQPQSNKSFWLGIILDPTRAFLQIERGPSPNDTDLANQFKLLWGPKKVELRRFRDGSVQLCTAWTGARDTATARICAHLVARHAKANVLPPHEDALIASELNVGVSPDDVSTATWHTFDALVENIRGIDDLPLAFVSAVPLAPVFRYADPAPCRATSSNRVPSYWTPYDVCLVLEGSGAWPEDVEALNDVKQSMYIQIATSLSKQFGLDCVAAREYVDVVKDGLPFRIRLFVKLELALLRARGSRLATQAAKDADPAVAAAAQRDLAQARKLDILGTAAPRLAAALHGLARQHAAFGATVRLFQRWLGAHLIGTTLDDLNVNGEYSRGIAAELLVARVFISPAPFASPPRTAMCAFVRVLLFVASGVWRHSPIIVPLHGALSAARTRAKPANDDVADDGDDENSEESSDASDDLEYDVDATSVSGRHTAKRARRRLVEQLDQVLRAHDHWMSRPTASLPEAAAFFLVGLPARVNGAAPLNWPSEVSPSQLVVHRLQSLTTASLFALHTTLPRQSDDQISAMQCVLKSSAKDFPARLLLSRAATRAPPRVPESRQHVPSAAVLGFDPVLQYVNALQRQFGKQAIFTFDVCERKCIGVVWRSGSPLPPFVAVPLLQQMVSLGGGIVEKVELA